MPSVFDPRVFDPKSHETGDGAKPGGEERAERGVKRKEKGMAKGGLHRVTNHEPQLSRGET